ncbi:glycosyltransferase family A protein [Herbiconiux sp.]|uniref:glycosyltransferase n=1 Tax=Herbiconiux sp. TaxID=1871186 RepID=UPI0025C39A76|nr:glycosyltransferase family A protein [Herbiconiux sp.]
MIERIDVVVPARDEEALLGACLESVLAAADALPGRIRTRIVVVLDDCTDGSVDVARSFGPRIRVVQTAFANVGRARAAGVEELLDSSVPRRGHWIASTDADSVVPRTWLREHRKAAESGALVALGRVLPRAADLDGEVLRAWHDLHLAPGRHVYGANLGVRADAYLLAGGFPPLASGEDEALVAAVEALDPGLLPVLGVVGEAPAPLVIDLGGAPVDTSGRTEGRTAGGFAGFLRRLVD